MPLRMEGTLVGSESKLGETPGTLLTSAKISLNVSKFNLQ